MDARKLTAEQSSEIRQKVVTLHQAGMAIKDIMLETGLCRQAVDRTIKRHQAGETQTPQARGKKQGSGQLLSEECQSSICDQVFSRRPWQLGMDVGGYLWTRESLQALILKQYGIEVSERVMRIYLQRWGIKQNTHKSRIERCTPTIRTWLMTHYPVVEAIAQSEGAKILWLCRHITIPHPFGANQQKRKKHTLMSVVDHRDSLSWIIMSGAAHAENQIRCLDALVKDHPRQKLYLIRHDDKLFNTAAVTDWLEEHQERIVLVPDLTNGQSTPIVGPEVTAEIL